MKKTPVAFTFGRANPPTVGHEKLVDKVKSVAKDVDGTPKVFLSHSQDHKKNPLSYDDKHSIAKKAFGSVVQHHNHKTIIDVMKHLQSSHNEAHIVVGSDRVDEMHTLLNKYNGKEYNFDKIHVHSAGTRDPDAEGVEGMSASKMRDAAHNEHKDTFKSGLPSKLSAADKEDAYHKVRTGLQKPEKQKTKLSEAEVPTNIAAIQSTDPVLLTAMRRLYLHLKMLKRRRQAQLYRVDEDAAP